MSDPCADPSQRLLNLDDALARIRAAITPLNDFEQVDLKRAYGRVLAADISARLDLPPFANSAVDGYALRVSDQAEGRTTGLRLFGTSYAGHPYLGDCESGSCIRIFTGAALPEGADTVVMQENVDIRNERVILKSSLRAGENVRPVGDEARAGVRLLECGKRLNAADLGILAAHGQYDVPVVRKLQVAFFSTGDELQSLGKPLALGEIYDSNRYILHALLQHPSVEAVDHGVVRDDPLAVREALAEAAIDSDLVITTGGVSVGEADYVAGALKDMGRVDFWKLAVKPGKPLAFGQIGQAYFFGLPGNPVSVIVGFWKFVRPALCWLSGTPSKPSLKLSATCLSRLKKTPGRVEFQRGRCHTDNRGQLVVSACAGQGSHQLLGISSANCLIVLPAQQGDVEVGDSVDIEPLGSEW